MSLRPPRPDKDTDTVLVLTQAQDHFVPERVVEEVESLGFRGLRVDTEHYPATLVQHLGVGPDGRPTGRLGEVPLDRVRGVYIRRPGPPALEGLPESTRATVRGECALHLKGLRDLLTATGAHLVNPEHAERAVEGHKLRQLMAAWRAGLAIPDTLVTNDPDEARAFAARHGDDVVAKMLGAVGWGFQRGAHVPTTHLTPDDLAALDGLRLGPMCLQPRLGSARELRVCWVDGEVFVGEMGGGEVPDWREGGRGGWRRGTLDATTHAAIDRLMNRLGLRTGSLDLLYPAEGGPPVFLEVNPSGEWGQLEHVLDLPVAAALARALTRDAPPATATPA